MSLTHRTYQTANNVFQIKHAKLFNLTWLANIFLVLGVIFLSIYLTSSYQRNNILYNVLTIKHESIKSIGAFGLYSFLWYIGINIIYFINITRYQNLDRAVFINLILGIMLINPYVYFYHIKHLKNKRQYFTETFYYLLDESNQIAFNFKNKKSVLAFIYLIIATGFIVFSSLDYLPVEIQKGINVIEPNTPIQVVYSKDLWFNNLQYFTTQGNWLCIFVALVVFLNPRTRFLKSNNLVLIATTYISIISLIWLTTLYPLASNKPNWRWIYDLSGFYNHLITPVMFHIFAWYLIKQNKVFKQENYIRAWAKFIFYLIIYICYALFLPLIGNVSVYGVVTNLWPNVNGSLWLFFFLVGFLAFVNLIYFIFYIIMLKVNKIPVKSLFKRKQTSAN
ncbi:DUF1600 domain-containing protein [Ureaplasma sp. ES3154-GEN]|uniref:DUF1600 domain-containing protein n=1 Tax=Ureaplasma sp. ES3154-GEN TaxID=2984844 RepID=UPI0021E6F7BD|nr:DUF1600 domain-containing protein [Ureaplasma sp. ES3154-GEN]MCV3743665.1 DUF1600 domain-containing protein [Ureaplasma sp. ES3154-GEN]